MKVMVAGFSRKPRPRFNHALPSAFVVQAASLEIIQSRLVGGNLAPFVRPSVISAKVFGSIPAA
jgi:hypothetical protein